MAKGHKENVIGRKNLEKFWREPTAPALRRPSKSIRVKKKERREGEKTEEEKRDTKRRIS